jgi:hypothetical protein
MNIPAFFDIVKHTIKIPMIIDMLINRIIPAAIMKGRFFSQKVLIQVKENVNYECKNKRKEAYRILCSRFSCHFGVSYPTLEIVLEVGIFCSSTGGE